MLAKSSTISKATYRKHHLTRWRSGWRYRRRVPTSLVGAVGRTEWSKYLGAISEPNAVVEARKLDVENDALIAHLKAMSKTEQDELAVAGGIEATEAQTQALLVALPFVEAVGLNFTEQSVDLDQPDTVDQIRTIRSSRELGTALRGKIDAQRTLVSKSRGDHPTSKMEALVSVWERVAAPRRKKSIDKKHLYLGRFVTVVGDMAPKDVRREHAVKFREAMEKKGESRTNIKHMLEELHRLFSVALSENLIDANPFSGVKVAKDGTAKFSDEERRKPFTGSQVQTILGTADGLDCRGADDLRWIIRLLAYHGARSGEICQLRSLDVTMTAGVPVLRITDEVGSLKNKFSKRDIPIHPECVGIIAYAAARTDKRWLFGEFSKAKDRTAVFQSWAARFLDETAGIKDDDLTMHSLRHTWRTVAREIDMPEAVSRSIMGHALGKDDHAAYGAGPSLAKRAEWMARVDPLKA